MNADTDHAMPERSASLTLDQIREGGQALVTLTQARLADCATAIGEGRFYDALGHINQAAAKLNALAQAESALGGLAEAFIVCAENVEAGMVIRGHGRVTEARRDDVEVAGSDPCVHMYFSIEGEEAELEIHGGSEVVIVREES